MNVPTNVDFTSSAQLSHIHKTIQYRVTDGQTDNLNQQSLPSHIMVQRKIKYLRCI